MTSPYDRLRAAQDSGVLYFDMGEGLERLDAERLRGRELVYEFNHSRPTETERRAELLRELFASAGEGLWIEPPVHLSYGDRIHFGDNCYVNFNFTAVDDAQVYIGNRVMFAPNVTITTAGHPIDPELRGTFQQFSYPVHIEDDVWIGSNAVIMPGVRIGAGSVVGAGAVVTKNVPPGVIVVGSPARILREIVEADKTFERFTPPSTLTR